MSVIAANCTNPMITTGHRAPATTPTPTHPRMGGLSPLLNRSAAANVAIAVISHPHKYTVIIGIAPSCGLEHQSAQSRSPLTLTRLTNADTRPAISAANERSNPMYTHMNFWPTVLVS